MMNKPKTWEDVQLGEERGKEKAYMNIFIIVVILLVIGGIFSLFSSGSSQSLNYEEGNEQPMCWEYWCK